MVKKLRFLFLLAFAALAMVNCNRSFGGKNPPASSDMFALSFQHDVIAYNGSSEIISAPDAVAFWAVKNNTQAIPTNTTSATTSYDVEHIRYEQGDSNVTAEHIKVLGGGHVWYRFEENGASMNTLIWEFFDRFDIYGKR